MYIWHIVSQTYFKYKKKKISTIRTKLKQEKNTQVSNIYIEFIFCRVSHEHGVDSKKNLKTEYEKGSRIIVIL